VNIKVLKHVIGGAPAGGGELVERRNPSDLDEVVSLAPDGGKIEVGAAVAAADVAFPAWRDASPEFRADVLGRIGDLVLERRDALGELLSRWSALVGSSGSSRARRFAFTE
jgi:aldehyde dehydrogenase (NAD+)